MKRAAAAYYLARYRCPRWLRWVVLALCARSLLIALPAEAQATRDEFTLEVHSPERATVSYYNAHPPSSHTFPPELTNGDLTVGIHVRMGSGPETIEVYPPEGWVAIPPMLDVIDGEIGTVELRRGQFFGF